MPITKGQGNPKWTFEETVLALGLLARSNWHVPAKSSADVQQLSETLRSLAVHPDTDRNETFRNADGVYLKLINLLSLHPAKASHKGLRSSRMDRQVWKRYWQSTEELRGLARTILKEGRQADGGQAAAEESARGGDQDDVSEGRLVSRIHRERERRSKRHKVLARARGRGDEVRCEACRRGPLPLGDLQTREAIFEVHHVVPLSESGATRMRLGDLSILSANCHRVLHRLIRSEGRWLAPSDLRGRLQGESLIEAGEAEAS